LLRRRLCGQNGGVSPALTPETRVQRAATAIWANAGTEAVVVSGLGEVFLALDGIGSEIWQLLEQPLALAEVVTHLRRRYQVDQPRCLAEVTTYLEMLLSHRVVTIVT
jgi:hypothetical protein